MSPAVLYDYARVLCIHHGLDPDRVDDLPWRDVELWMLVEPQLASRPISYGDP